MTPQQQALGIILGEHQAMTAVIDALKHVAEQIALGKLAPDYRLLWSIVYYIDEFPEALHQPKEDNALFPRIRLRSHAIDGLLDDLGRQHSTSGAHLDELKTLLGRMEAEIPDSASRFAAKVATYAEFLYRHMALEESVVLPKADEVLAAEDWEDIAARFAENNDPLQDKSATSNDWFRHFYSRIVALVPEPWGLAARR